MTLTLARKGKKVRILDRESLARTRRVLRTNRASAKGARGWAEKPDDLATLTAETVFLWCFSPRGDCGLCGECGGMQPLGVAPAERPTGMKRLVWRYVC